MPQCGAIAHTTGKRCTLDACKGKVTCQMHGGTKGEYMGDPISPTIEAIATRRERLGRIFGKKFQQIADDATSFQSFPEDNAILLMREEELAERTQTGDSLEFRKQVKEQAEELIDTYKRSHTETNPKLLRDLEALAEMAKQAVKHDHAWEALLSNTERRVRVVTSAMQAIARQEGTITFADLVKKFDQVITIVYAEAGDELTARITARIEREIFGIYRSVAASTEQEAIAALGSGEPLRESDV